jgi:hypothetical protein
MGKSSVFNRNAISVQNNGSKLDDFVFLPVATGGLTPCVNRVFASPKFGFLATHNQTVERQTPKNALTTSRSGHAKICHDHFKKGANRFWVKQRRDRDSRFCEPPRCSANYFYCNCYKRVLFHQQFTVRALFVPSISHEHLMRNEERVLKFFFRKGFNGHARTQASHTSTSDETPSFRLRQTPTIQLPILTAVSNITMLLFCSGQQATTWRRTHRTMTPNMGSITRIHCTNKEGCLQRFCFGNGWFSWDLYLQEQGTCTCVLAMDQMIFVSCRLAKS